MESTIGRPASSRGPALVALYTGLTLTVVAAIAPFADRATTRVLAGHIREGYPAYSPGRVDEAVTAYLVILTTIGGLGVIGWLVTTWAFTAGKRWARWNAATTFTIGTLVSLGLLLTEDTSGDTGLAPALGWIGMLPCLAGLVAVIAMWRERPR